MSKKASTVLIVLIIVSLILNLATIGYFYKSEIDTNRSVTEVNASLEKNVSTLEQRLNAADSTVSGIAFDLTRTREDLTATKAELASAQEQIISLTDELNASNMKLDSAKAELSTSQETISILDSQLRSTNSELQSTQAALSEAQSNISLLSTVLDESNNGLVTLNDELAETVKGLSSAQSEISSLKEEISGTNEAAKATDAELATAQDAIATLNQEMTIVDGLILTIQEVLRTGQADTQTISENVTSIETGLSDIENSLASVQQDITSFKMELDDTNTHIAAIKAELAYNKAVTLEANGKYEEALTIFEALPEKQECSEHIKNCRYNLALANKETAPYRDVIKAFSDLGDYAYSKTHLAEIENAVAEYELELKRLDYVDSQLSILHKKGISMLENNAPVLATDFIGQLKAIDSKALSAQAVLRGIPIPNTLSELRQITSEAKGIEYSELLADYEKVIVQVEKNRELYAYLHSFDGSLEKAKAATATEIPMPSSLYSQRNDSVKVTDASWKTDKQSRINHGITEIRVLPSENSGHVLSITGWSFGTYTIANSRGWDGKSNITYLTVTNEKKQTMYYEVMVNAGATGIEHTTPYGKNMELADFVCNIDVSSYPDGTYTLGSANYFRITHNGQNNTMHHAYSFDNDYRFSIRSGYVVSFGSIMPASTPKPTLKAIEFAETFSSLYTHALSDGTAIYRSPDINDIWDYVNVAHEFPLIATSDEWLKIVNPINGYVAYVLKNEFAVYHKDDAAPVATEEPTNVPTPKSTFTPTPTSAPTSGPIFQLYLSEEYELGDYVKYGSYEQDGDTDNGKEPIVWEIIDIVDGKALLLSVHTLDRISYNMGTARGVTWQNSNLNRWLREEFYNEAFSMYEKISITPMPETAVNGDDVKNDYTDAMVSILSELQIKKYLPDAAQRSCIPSHYASAMGGKASNGASAWFTWAAGEISQYGRFVTSSGAVYLASELNNHILVRPCIWVKLYNRSGAGSPDSSSIAELEQAFVTPTPILTPTPTVEPEDQPGFGIFDTITEFMRDSKKENDENVIGPMPKPTPKQTIMPTPTPTMEPTATPTAEPTSTPVPVYDPDWINDSSAIKRFQDMLISMGWLDKATLDVMGEYGTLGDVTYAAIWEVQQYANDRSMAPVQDAAGFMRTQNGSGEYYPIDEATYNYIMNQLVYKP